MRWGHVFRSQTVAYVWCAGAGCWVRPLFVYFPLRSMPSRWMQVI